MKTIHLMTLITMFVVFNSCDKNEDLYGKKTLKGRLYVTNTFNGSGQPKLLVNTEIRISFNHNNPSLNYDRAVKTDENGFYIFNNLPDKDFRVFCQTTIDGLRYNLLGDLKGNLENQDLYLIPDPDYLKGLILKVTDINMQNISNIRVGIYSSRILANRDSDYSLTQPITTNTLGEVFFTDRRNGKYFVKVLDSLGIYRFQGLDSANITGNLDIKTMVVH